MLQNNQSELQRKAAEDFIPNATVVDRLTKMGFHPDIVNACLRQACNNMDEAVEMALRMQTDGNFEQMLNGLLTSTSEASTSVACAAAQIVESIQNDSLKENDADTQAVNE